MLAQKLTLPTTRLNQVLDPPRTSSAYEALAEGPEGEIRKTTEPEYYAPSGQQVNPLTQVSLVYAHTTTPSRSCIVDAVLA